MGRHKLAFCSLPSNSPKVARWNQVVAISNENDFEGSCALTLRVRGPRAYEFWKLLKDFSGAPLIMAGGGEIRWSMDGTIDPFESKTLQMLISDIIKSANVVQITAFGGHQESGTWGDSFFGNPGLRPRRSVFVEDFREVEKSSSVGARILVAHVLKEYLAGARPAGTTPGRAFSNYHADALRTEAEIARDLTGRAIWAGGHRPWEHTFGNTNVRSYGPSLKFQFTFDSAWNVRNVKEPPGL